MADHSKPLSTSTYANFVSELDARLDDLTLGLDPAYTTPTNLATNAIRYSSAATKWQKWNGTSWVDLAATYAISVTGNAGTVTNGVVTTGSYSDPAWLTSLSGSKISGGIAGNAASATVLATARTINGVSFNGSANISVNTNSNITFNNAGSGAASGVTFNGGSAITVSYNTVGAPSTTGANASGTWGISISGNAATATTAGSSGSVTNGVYTVGDQTIGGAKTFSSLVTGRSSGNTDGLYAFQATTTGGAFAQMWSRRGPYTSFVNHTGSSFAPTVSVAYEYTGSYSGVYSIGHLTNNASDPGSLAIHHINSSGAANVSWLFSGATGSLSLVGGVNAEGAVSARGVEVLSGSVLTFVGKGSQSTPAIGDNQTWQAPTRAAATWYQNTTGRAIMVNIVFGSYQGGSIYVGSSTTSYVTAHYGSNDIRHNTPMTVIVPNNSFYYYDGSYVSWYELR